MNQPLVRTAMVVGAAIALLNVLFTGMRYGFANLPMWFFGVQLVLLPLMVFTLQFFARASITRDFLSRAALYAVGWLPPYLVYNLSSEALRPNVNWQAALTSTVMFVLVFALLFAMIRKPQ